MKELGPPRAGTRGSHTNRIAQPAQPNPTSRAGYQHTAAHTPHRYRIAAWGGIIKTWVLLFAHGCQKDQGVVLDYFGLVWDVLEPDKLRTFRTWGCGVCKPPPSSPRPRSLTLLPQSHLLHLSFVVFASSRPHAPRQLSADSRMTFPSAWLLSDRSSPPRTATDRRLEHPRTTLRQWRRHTLTHARTCDIFPRPA